VGFKFISEQQHAKQNAYTTRKLAQLSTDCTAQIKALMNEAPTTILGIQPIVHLESCHIL
jgi:hypothetical protein